ncbi:hypothetical protein ABZN20_18960 [Methylococcus sp. ANG]|uniref:hypothetical protein n=1 Tax=Methylococcus sp. ANG TaxID=3231903 RepID=UPI00345AFD91
MQLKKIAAAVAAGTLGFCGQGWALEPGVSPDIEIFVSGAGAQDNNLRRLFEELCVAGTLDTYFDNASPASPGALYTAIFCTLDSAKVPGLSVNNPKVLFHKRTAGAAAMGVNPVLDAQPIDQMAINNGNCTRTPPDQFFRCRISQPGDLAPVVSDAGISNPGPEIFWGTNTPDGVAPVNPGKVIERMEVKSGGSILFNVPVTRSLRDALQRAQIDSGELAPECETQDTEPCMPSLSKQQIASLFTGSIGKWSEFQVVSKNGGSAPLTTYAGAGDLSDDKVHLCRRADGAGVQAQANVTFLNYPCADGAPTPARTSNPLLGPVVLHAPSPGSMDLCLKDFNDGTNDSTFNPTGTKAWAIGIQSTERNVNLKWNYRSIKIDGVAPTLGNAARGHYQFWADVTYQWLKAAFNGPTGDKLKIIERLAADAGKPSILAKNNAAFVHPFGPAGYLATSVAGHPVPPDGVFDPNVPVSPYTRGPGGLSLDTCRVPVIDGRKPNRL